MVVEGAAEAELVLAHAAYRGYDPTEVAGFDGTVDGILAVWSRTPPEVILVIDVGPGEKSVVSSKDSMLIDLSIARTQPLLTDP